AREVLELHTLGVEGPYDQRDVHELAKLLTGLAATRNHAFKFRQNMIEPGPKTVLGRTYGAEKGMRAIRKALNDVALHPSTARHIAHKLVVHFVSDTPPGEIVSAVEAAYLRTGGDLFACYGALLDHSDAWQPQRPNMRPPEEFVAAALRALAPTQTTLEGLKGKAARELFFQPLNLMGQPWMRPTGPDGFAEEDMAWITPQGISARLEWAMNAPARLLDTLPEPNTFVRTALGGEVPEAVAFAASAAEDRQVATGLILSSPAFQRR
ncbi:MAG: DUF1800 family protein, partial [Sulfitobacter sp.]|nr:DUF1800 family protein [Sulfitobacter sp.]